MLCVTTALAAALLVTASEKEKSLKKRFVFPLAYYAGQAVTALVFSSLVLHYGARAVRDAGITELDEDDWEASE